MFTTGGAPRASATEEGAGPFRILDLPPELAELVFEKLDEEDPFTILNVRQVSRAFRHHSLVAFGTTFFEHVVAMLHPLSLTKLFEIANHQSLAKFVRQITISGECIGGIVGMGGQEDVPKLQDLQTSMRCSGMDLLVLTDVFRKLTSLTGVRVDNESSRCHTEVLDAARCGSRSIFTHCTVFNLDSLQRGINRAFEVVMKCLRNTGLAGKVDMFVSLDVTTHAPMNSDYFEPTSDTWVNSFAVNVKALELKGYVSSRWSLDLMRSVPNLRTLQTCFVDDLLQFSHPDTGPFVWHDLRQLDLDVAYCHAPVLSGFLVAHKDTLFELGLRSIELISGSWLETFQLIIDMPRLKGMILSAPHEMTSPPQDADTFDHNSDSRDVDVHNFFLYNNTEIRLAVGALLYDLRTTSYLHHTGYHEISLYCVDMRLARAVLDGRAVISDGKCNLVQHDSEKPAPS